MMLTSTDSIFDIFTDLGATLVIPKEEFIEKTKKIKAFIFDWDGVFNDATKNENGSSNFSEVDSMGTNLLRFGWWLSTNGQMPYVAIISGERNVFSFQLTQREHFHGCYYRIKHKIAALEHFMASYNLTLDEIAFFFDDALDLSIAEKCGLRIMIRHQGNPLFQKYVVENNLVDYITAQEGGNFAVREGCELLLGIKGVFDETIAKRQLFYPDYNQYLTQRQSIKSNLFTLIEGAFEAQNF
ncbi:phosphatase [Runella zeae]|uniref:phosphatase n=1 Tax=Runella zeae TaxID=94255 RepID=UPI0003FF09DF|nr:phosphatase [Runella zeae]